MSETIKYLYYLKIYDIISNTNYWKIGIEKKQYSRWKTNKYFNIEYIWSIPEKEEKVLYAEEAIKQRYKTGITNLVACFANKGGETEALPYNFLKTLSMKDIADLLQEEIWTISTISRKGYLSHGLVRGEIDRQFPEIIIPHKRILLTKEQGQSVLNALLKKYPIPDFIKELEANNWKR